MAQVQVTTNEGFGELAMQCTAGEAASAINSCVCLRATCCATEACVNADLNYAIATGLTIADATMTTSATTVANDTIQLDHSFNAQQVQAVLGFACFNDDNDVAMGICCFDASVPLEVNDLLNVQFKWAFAIQA